MGRPKREVREARYEKLEEDLKRLREVLEELAEEGAKRIGRMHREYLWAEGPNGKHKEAKKEKPAPDTGCGC